MLIGAYRSIVFRVVLVVVVCVQVRKRCSFVLVGVATRKDFTVGQPLVKIEEI